jgi:hypothetical protein
MRKAQDGSFDRAPPGPATYAEMSEVRVAFCDETDFGFGWIAVEPKLLQRASHALTADGRVWLVDPVDGAGVEERVRALGEPAGVLQLVDRHPRDCAVLAERLGVPHLRLPFGGVPGSPFEARKVLNVPGWREVALWWEAERVLVCTEALGTVPYFRAPGEPLGVHPFLRLYQPRGLRDMARCLAPGHVLVGHGEGIHGEGAAAALAQAVRGARRTTPRWLRDQLQRRRER